MVSLQSWYHGLGKHHMRLRYLTLNPTQIPSNKSQILELGRASKPWMPYSLGSTYLDKRRKPNHVDVLFHSSHLLQNSIRSYPHRDIIAPGGDSGRKVTAETVLNCNMQLTRGDTPAISWLEGPVSSVFVPPTLSEKALFLVLGDLELFDISRKCKRSRNGRWRVLEYSWVECIINRRLRK